MTTYLKGHRKFSNFDLRWNEPLGNPDCPYAFRWAVIAFGFSIRLHHWIGDDENMHDHPWWFITFMVKGGYADRSPAPLGPDGYEIMDIVNPGEFRFRPAEWRHRVTLDGGSDTWTVLLTGPRARDWGFYLPGNPNMIRPLAYFKKYGHHPCEDK